MTPGNALVAGRPPAGSTVLGFFKRRASTLAKYHERRQRIQALVRGSAAPMRMRKKSTSHLFRYWRRSNGPHTRVRLDPFHHVLDIDVGNRTLDVEGSASYETIVDHTLSLGLAPTVTPELKGISVGGAIAGIGIESSCFRYGFVHDGLVEADVLLPNGDVVTCSADNDHCALFLALPNSYGTLGYVLRARMTLVPVEPYVRVTSSRCTSVAEFLGAMCSATADPGVDFIDGLIYSGSESYVVTGRFSSGVTGRLASIYGDTPYYKMTRLAREFVLSTRDYLFRYDPDWFWNVPETGPYTLLRKVMPRSMRHSGLYSRYSSAVATLTGSLAGGRREEGAEQLIQDWEVPWDRAEEMTSFALERVDLAGKPWAAVPVRPRRRATLYPLEPDTLYFNLGCYCWTKRPSREPFYYTKLMDGECVALGGIKMLYSSSFVDEGEFGRLYNGQAYERLKRTYDPGGRTPTLYQKVTGRR